jgi:hypothetical protein
MDPAPTAEAGLIDRVQGRCAPGAGLFQAFGAGQLPITLKSGSVPEASSSRVS